MTRAFLLFCGLSAFAVTSLPAFQCPDGTPPPCVRASGPASNSVAVLVFENRARDTSLTLLAEGLADEITASLGNIPRLEVRSPASVRVVLANGSREPRRLGRALGVRYLVDGQLLGARGSVRVSVELVDATRERVRWTSRYQRPTDDLFGLITTIADSVAAGIVGELASADRAPRATLPTRSPPAYEAFVKGTAALRRSDEASLRRAVAFFEEATGLDSGFAAAWAGLSEAWQWLDSWEPPRVVNPRARAAADRALSLDSVSVPARAALAGVALGFDWDFARAEQLARQALALSPRYPRAHLYLGESLLLQGRTAEATGELQRAVAADTLDEVVAGDVATYLIVLGHQDDLMRLVERWRVASPHSTWPERSVLILRIAAGRCGPSDVTGQWERRDVRDALVVWCVEGKQSAHAYVDSVVADARQTGRYMRADLVAREYARLGDTELALSWFEQAIEERDGGVAIFPRYPWCSQLRNDPRFAELWRRTGLPLPSAP